MERNFHIRIVNYYFFNLKLIFQKWWGLTVAKPSLRRVSQPPEAKNKTSGGSRRVPASAAATYHILTSILPHSRCNQVKPYGLGRRAGARPSRGVPSQDQVISHVEIPQKTTTCGQLPSWRWKTENRQRANREIRAFCFHGISETAESCFNDWTSSFSLFYFLFCSFKVVKFQPTWHAHIYFEQTCCSLSLNTEVYTEWWWLQWCQYTEQKELHCVVRTAQRVEGLEHPHLKDVYTNGPRKEASNII